MKKEKHRPFIRISWEEALEVLANNLRDKYKAKGELVFMHDYGYEGVSEHYEFPNFVDIYLDPQEPQN